jgi:hypothetical protein
MDMMSACSIWELPFLLQVMMRFLPAMGMIAADKVDSFFLIFLPQLVVSKLFTVSFMNVCSQAWS